MIKAANARRFSVAGPHHCAVLAAVFLLGGCGDDPVPTPPKSSTSTKVKQKKRKRGRQTAAPASQLQFYSKVESYVPEAEASGIRHQFVERDFESDLSGDVNRDPFRSYVIRQPGIGPQERTQSGNLEPTKVCSSNNLVASGYSLRDLRLVGIVLRGTRSYALFRDSASYGHIVEKGDCLGQEKARVGAIRAGFVTLQVLTDSAPNQPPQERAIQLYPEDYNFDSEQR